MDKSITSEERIDTALQLAVDYGQVDKPRHIKWLVDQMVRALTGCQMDGATGTLELGPEYERWVEEYQNGEEGQYTYAWDEGTAP